MLLVSWQGLYWICRLFLVVQSFWQYWFFQSRNMMCLAVSENPWFSWPISYSFLGIGLLPPQVGLCVVSHFSGVQFCTTLWTVDCQAPLSMGFSRREYWSRLPCPSPGDFPNPGIKPVPSPVFCITGRFLIWGTQEAP